jgi:hypothetical protein
MAYGIEIYAADGTLQANSEMICWFCRKTGTGTTTFRTVGNTPTSTLTVDVTGITNPIVAIRIAGYTAAKAGGSTYITNAPIGTSYTYYIFDYAQSLPANAGSYGIEIFNATGVRTFNSNFFPMQVLNMLTGSDPFNSETVTHTGKTLAIANASMGGYATRGDPYCYDTGGPEIWDGFNYCGSLGLINDCKLYGGILTNSFQTATTSNASFDDVTLSIGDSNNYTIPPDWNTASKLLVIDVTNIPVPATFY